MTPRACIGTSGWMYDGWRRGFYRGQPKRAWLGICARHFTALEINATFYRLQQRATFARWRAHTPARFRFALKANRYLTHHRKLAAPAASIRLERDRASPLGGKLAVVLWQLPRKLHRDLARLEAFARALRRWPGVRHAVEFRHASWFCDEVAACLRRHRIANCQSDAADWPRWDTVSTNLVYVRLHGRPVTYASNYTDTELRAWAAKVRRWLREGRAVHVYFDNDAYGHAPRNAARLAELVRGLSPVSPRQSRTRDPGNPRAAPRASRARCRRACARAAS